MPLIDTHCHYNMSPLYENWRDHWRKAQEFGVEKSIVVGTNLETSRRGIEITSDQENLFAAVGIHPYVYNQADKTTTLQEDKAELEKLFTTDSSLLSLIGIGETGLDYFRLANNSNRPTVIEAQQAAFRMHIKLALQHKKLLIVHVRDQETLEEPTEGNAYWDAIKILSEFFEVRSKKKGQLSWQEERRPSQNLAQQMYENANNLITSYTDNLQPTTDNFILHCASGPLTYIDQAINLGAYFGVAGNVTYKTADRIREIVRRVPADRLLLETDAPFLAPQSYRGQQCEPWMVSETANFLENVTINA